MMRIVVIVILSLVASVASAETIGVNPTVTCPGKVIVTEQNLFKCNLIGHTTPKFGIQIWSPMVNPFGCASGYEQACYARDHGTDGLRRSEQHK